MKRSLKTLFSAIFTVAGTAGAFAEVRNLPDSYDFLGWWEYFYSPARRAIERGTNTVMPAYGSAAVRFPSSVNRGGEISSFAFGAGASWTFVSEEEKFVSVSNLDFQRTDYRFSGTPETLSPVGSDPFSHVDSLKAFNWSEFVFDKANGRALAFLAAASFAAADSTASSHGVNASLGFAYKQYFSRTTSVCGGVLCAYSRHKERWTILPLVLVDYAPTRDVNMRLGNGINLTWNVGGKDEWILSAGVSYSGECIAVADGEYWYTQSVPASLVARRNLGKNFFVSLGMSALLWTDYRYWANSHKTDFHFTSETALAISLQAGLRF